MTTSNPIEIKQQDNLAIVTFNHPPVNAIETTFLRETANSLAECEKNKEIKAVVLTGTGNSFSVGLDLKAVPSYNPKQQKELVVALNDAITALYASPLPIVAAINGHAIAGGLILALACDYRISTDSPCKIGLTEVRVGIPFPVSAISVVKAELTAPVTRKLVLLGQNISPQEALKQEIVDELQPSDKVLSRAIEQAQEMASLPLEAFAKIKEELRNSTILQLKEFQKSQSDPVLESWLTPETASASAKILQKKQDI